MANHILQHYLSESELSDLYEFCFQCSTIPTLSDVEEKALATQAAADSEEAFEKLVWSKLPQLAGYVRTVPSSIQPALLLSGYASLREAVEGFDFSQDQISFASHFSRIMGSLISAHLSSIE